MTRKGLIITKHIRTIKELSSILTATSSAHFATRDENSAMGLKALANMHITSEGIAALTEVWFNNNPFQSLTTFATHY